MPRIPSIGPLVPAGAALLLFLGTVVWAFVAQLDTTDARRLVTRTYEAIGRQDELLTALVDAETGQRGFLLTGEERYLEPYAAALPRIDRDLAGLRAATGEDLARSARLAELRRLIDAKLAELDRTIALRRSAGVEAAAAVLRTDDGKRLMDAIRALLADLRAGERAVLDDRLARLERRAAVATGALALAGLLALALGGTTGALLLREARAGRRRAERALSEEEAHARAILELNPQVLWTARPDGGIEDFAARWLEWTGLTREQALGEGWAQVPHPDDLPRMAEAWARSVATGEPYDVDHRVRMADGSFRWMRSRAVARHDPATGAVLRWYGTTEDVHERYLAEERLREGEARFRAMADNIPQLAWMGRPDGWLFWYNRRWFDYTGTTQEEMDGWGWRKVHHPDHVDRVVARIQRAWDTGEPWEDTFPLRGKDGGYRWFLSRALPIRDAEGRVALWFGTNTDVTAIREAETALRDSEARLRATVALAPLPIMLHAEDGEILQASEALQEISGWRWPEDIPTVADWAERAYGERRETLRAHIDTLYALDRRVQEGDYRIRTKHDGERVWSFGSAPVGRDARGRRLVVSMAADLTEQRQAEEALRRTLAEQRAVYANAPVGLSAHDRELRFLAVNERIAAINGLPAEDHIGRTPREVIPAAEGFVEPLLRRVLETGEPVPEVEIETETAAHPGERRFYLASYYPVRAAEEGGEVEGVSVAVLDIDARKRAEAALRDLAATLERRVEERTLALADTVAQLDAFAYTISHDLRAPLRAMDGFAKILLEDHAEALGERGRRYAERIVGAARRMDELIQDLLAYSRLSRADVELGWVDLEAVVDAVAADLVVGHAEPAPPEVAVERPLPPVRANRAVLAQMVANLLGNAAKFVVAGERARLRVRAERRDGGRLRLWVEDNGIGIAPEHQARIFNVFERLHGQESYPGTGIGLAIVRKGAERMGGAAGVESEGPGRGSRFWVELPLTGRGGGAP